ncbi:MAG: ComF family protein [Pseudomonadota bacterium]
MHTPILNLLFPPQCLNCECRVPTHGTLCIPCWQQIHFITEPMCHACGLPFDYDIGDGALCGACMHKHPDYNHARAVFRYDEHSRKLITRFKYSDHTQLAKIYGTWLMGTGGKLLEQSDMIIPVPLHYFRFLHRRFNQSALLAHTLSKKSSVKCLPNALIRTRKTTPQTGLTRKQRETNVKGAFTINKRSVRVIKGKNILLIDDVFTTGSTIEQCTKVLLKAGAAQVNVLTLARAIK